MMRKLFGLMSLALIATMALAGSKSWYTFNEGLQKAQQEQKHIIIDFYTDWCGWCKVMDQKTFSVPEVEKYLFDNFVPIRINAENRTEKLKFQNKLFTPRELTAAFQISGYPSVAFLTPAQEIITVVPGYIEKAQFLKILEFINQECYKTDISYEQFLKSGCKGAQAVKSTTK